MRLLSEIFGKSVGPKLGFTLFWLLVLVAVQLYQDSLPYRLSFLGIRPRHLNGLVGIALAPFIHASWAHLWGNLLALGLALFTCLVFYSRLLDRVVLWVVGAGGLLVWLGARDSYHVGASGVVYGLVFFLLFSGVFRRDRPAAAVAVLIIFLNQGLVWGLFPQQGVSFEAHLAGALVGLWVAYRYRHRAPGGPPPPPPSAPPGPDLPADVWDYRRHVKVK